MGDLPRHWGGVCIAILGIYILVVSQFGSSKVPFTATSVIGFIALAGIIVRNTATPGRPLMEVLIEAGAVRFKPILLTALAAMIGAL